MNTWQIAVSAIFLAGALRAAWFCLRDVSPRARGLVLCGCGLALLAAVAIVAVAFPRDTRQELQATAKLPQRKSDRQFVSSSSCRSCHPDQYASWHATYHRTMTQVATPETVQAPFDDVELELDGRSYRLWRNGDEFWAEMPDPDRESLLSTRGRDLARAEVDKVQRRVVLTTGSHRMQHYWVASPQEQGLLGLPWEFHIAEQRWIPMLDAHVIPPDQPRSVGQWNSQCIVCHALDGVPGFDPRSGLWSPQVAELGISCEACHGPGEKHVAHHRNPLNRLRQRSSTGPDPTIVNPARTSSKVSAEICGQCHSTFHMTNEGGQPDFASYLMGGGRYQAGGDLASSRRMLSTQPPGTTESYFRNVYWNETDVRDAFWGDGSARVGGREFLGLLSTSCFLNGEMSCLSCHSMHRSNPAGQLARHMDGNAACLQCHESIAEDLTAHTHHSATSSGSLCYNCHMPHTSFALLRAARSHRVDSPSADSSARTGRPNACNLCHLDQTLEWTGRHLSAWFGSPPPELDSDQREVSAALLWLMRGDAAQRAVTAWHAGWKPALEASGHDWQAPILSQLFVDPYSVVRYVAITALNKLPHFEQLEVDYLGSEQHRSEARQRVREVWADHPVSSPANRLLLDQHGNLQQDRLEELLKQRDDTPVKILE